MKFVIRRFHKKNFYSMNEHVDIEVIEKIRKQHTPQLRHF
jgi:hypothetical protein